MPRKKLTIQEMLDLKGKRQLTEVFVETPEQAAACEAAGIDMLVCMDRVAEAVRKAAPHVFQVVPVLAGEAAASDAEAIRLGVKRMEKGADAIYTGLGFNRVRAMAEQYIPVIGHVGLVPYRSSWTGGFKAVGKTADSALWVYENTLRYEDAGAIGVEMEIVPERVAAEIAQRVNLLVISMGSGSGGDAQYLFACDILGTNRGHIPRHAKVYRNLAAEYDRIQQEAIAAFSEFKADVDSGAYPEEGHNLKIKEAEFKAFLDSIGE